MKIKKNSVRNRGTAWIFNGLALVTMMLFLIGLPAFGQYSLTNTTQIKINNDTISSGEAANGYPSTVSVPPSVTGILEKVTVTLDGFTHSYPNDVVMMLVAPNNNAVTLMGNDGAGVSVTDLTLTFDDVVAGAGTLGVATAITSGTNKTGDNATIGTNGVQFPAPAPTVTFQANLAALVATLTPAVGAPTNYTGAWSLYVLDDSQPATGSIGSWSLNLYTEPVVAVTNTSVTVAENQSSNFFFTVNDSSTNGALTATVTLGTITNGNIGYTNSNGSFSNFVSTGDFVFNGGGAILANGTNMVTITPNADLYGTASFQVTVKDANGVTVLSSNIDLTVTHVAVAPAISLVNQTITTTVGVASTTNLISLISQDGNAGSTMQFSVVATNGIGNVGVNSNVFTNYAGLPASMPPSIGRTNNFYFSIVPGGFPVGTSFLNFIATDPTAGLSVTQVVTVVVNPLTNGVLTGPLVYSNTNSLIVAPGPLSSATLGFITITNLNNIGAIGKVTVSVLGLTNIVPEYLGLELQAPDGTLVPLIGTASGASPSTYAELTFADSAGTPNAHIDNNLPAASGNPVLTNYVLNATASGTALAAALGGHSPTNIGPNVWTLTVSNNNPVNALGISGGWVLVVYPAPAVQESVAAATIPESASTNITFVTADTLGVQSGTPTVTLNPSTTATYSGTALASSSVATIGSTTINGTNYTTNVVTLTGKANEAGSATVTVVVSETNGPAGVAPSTFTATNSLLLTVSFVAQAPTIGFIENQVTFAGDAILNIPFVISSPDTNASALTINISSANQALLPTSAFQSNSVVNRGPSNGQPPPSPSVQTNYLSLYPVGTKGGESTITVSVSDGVNTVSTNFLLVVGAAGNPLYENTTPINIPAQNTNGSPYPSSVAVTGLVGTVENVIVTVFDVTEAGNASGLNLLLVGPTNATGQSSNVYLMGDAGQGTGLTNANLIFSNSLSGPDTGALILPESSEIFSTNIYIPTNYGLNAYTSPAIFGAPGPGVTGYGTNLVSSYKGISPNGTWSLYAFDTNGIRGGAIFGGWQLSIITAPNISPTTTNYTTLENTPTNIVVPVGDAEADNTTLNVTATVTASGASTSPSITVVSPALVTNNGVANLAVLQVTPILYQFGTNNVHVVATDSSGSTSTADLQVIVLFNPQPPIFLVTNLSITTPAAVPINGVPFAVWDPQTTNENTITVSSTGLSPAPVITVTTNATIGGTNGYSLNIQPIGVGTGTATITVAVLDGDNETTKTNFTLTVTPNLAFASTGSLTLGPGAPEQELGSPYPWNVNVPNTVVGSVTGVKVNLVGVTHNDISDVDLLLVSPDGAHSVILMANAGDGAAVNNLNLGFSQTAGTPILEFSTLTNGTYMPASYVGGLVFPAPAPATGYSENLATEFAGLAPSGNWSLYALDSAFPDSGSISSWILFLTTGPAITNIPNQKVAENGTLNVPIGLTDSSTSVANLSVIVTNNLGVVLTNNTSPLIVTEQGVGTPSGVTNLVITPVPNYPSAEEALGGFAPTNSTNVITVVVSDSGGNTVMTSFTNIVVWGAQAPVIVSTSTNNLVIPENGSGQISFTVSNVDAFLTASSVNLISTNLALVNTNGIVTNSTIVGSLTPGATSGTITYTVMPVSDVFGTNVGELVFTAMNSNGLSASTSVTLSVVHVVQPPTIQPFFAGVYQLFPGETSTNIPFTVGTLESGATLNITASSSNPNVVPNSQNNILINPTSFANVSPGSYKGSNIIIIPSSAPPGMSTITVTNTQIVAGTTNAVTASFIIQVLQSPTTLFANPAPIANVATNPIASPYPSTNLVTNLVGGIFSVSVTLNAITASDPSDVTIVLEAPNGTSTLLLSDAGGTTAAENITLTFNDTNGLAPSNAPLAVNGGSASYHPTSYDGGSTPLPTNGNAPAPPYFDRMAVFSGINPNGTWKLWVVDNTSNDIVSIANGWTLSISTAPEIALDTNPPPPALTIPENAAGQNNKGTVSFHVIDSTGGTDSIVVTGTPSADYSSITVSPPTLINNSTNDYTATIIPAAYASGTNVLTFTVNRNDGASDSVTYTNIITKSNMIPTLTRLGPITTNENLTGQTEFFVTVLGDPLSTVTVWAYSTNTALVPNTNLTFSGGSTTSGVTTNTNMVNLSLFASSVPNAGDLVLNMTPAPNMAGQTEIIVLVSNNDGAFNSPTGVSNAFLFSVIPQQYNPTFANLPATASVTGGNADNITFQVNSLDSTPPIITVTAVNQSGANGTTVGTITTAAGPNGSNQFNGTSSNIAASTWTVPLVSAVTTSEYKSTILFTATDANGLTATATLTLTTVPVLQHFYSNSTPIDIVDVSPSIPSPSTISVDGLVGNVSQIVVTLDGFGHQYPSDVGVLLVGPNGSNTVLMNNAGSGVPVTGLDLTFSESAGAPAPASQALSTGTFLPSDYQPVKPYNFELTGPNNPNPGYGPVGSTNPPPPSGPYATNLNVFNGLNPNTNWFLYVQDDSAGDVGNIAGGWTLQIYTQPTIVFTGLTSITNAEGDANGKTTFVILDDSAIAQANYTSNSFGVTSTNSALLAPANVTFTGSGTNWTANFNPTADVAGTTLVTIFATNSYSQVSSNTFQVTITPVNFPPVITQPANGSVVTITAGLQTTLALGYGDVGYADNTLIVSATSAPLSPQNPVPNSSLALVANGPGPDNLVITPVGTLTGSNLITLTVTQPGVGGVTTNATFTLVVASGTSPTFANTNAITINQDSAATPYPSQIDVAGVGANILKVTATLVGFSHTFPSDVSALLVGPHGQNVMLFSDEGGGIGVSNLRLTFDDSGTAMSPTGPLTSGTNAPALSDLRFIDSQPDFTNFAAQVSPPYGHMMSVFSNTAANGIWSLYVFDDNKPDTGAISDGWELTFETVGPMITPLAPVIMSENTSVTLPFTVSSATTAASNITVAVSASSEVPSNLIASLVISGQQMTNETLTITPTTNYPSAVTNINGSATITLILTDNHTNSSTNTFPLTVLRTDIPGLINLPVATTNTPANASLSIPFTVFDVQGTSNLIVSASMTPDIGTVSITTNGGGGNYTLLFTPDGATTTTTVTVVESDGTASASNSLQITVTAGVPPVVTVATNTSTPENSVTSIPFSLAYIALPYSLNNISATASNTNLVTALSIATNGQGTNFVVNVTLAAYETGTSTITISANDQYGTGSNSTLLTVTRVEYPPVLAPIANTNTLANTPVSIVLNVSDIAMSITNLTYSAQNSDSNVIAAVNFSYVGTNEVVTLVPVTNATGASAITIVVGDGVTNVSQAFAVTVTAPTPPSLAPIANQTAVENTAVQVPLDVTSPETPITNLTFTGTAATNFVKSITFQFIGSNEVATITPDTGALGTGPVTILVSDGISTASQTFSLQVVAPAPPTLTPTVTSGVLELKFTGVPGATYTIQSSTDLINWRGVASVTANSVTGAAQYEATISNTAPGLFYRIVGP